MHKDKLYTVSGANNEKPDRNTSIPPSQIDFI